MPSLLTSVTRGYRIHSVKPNKKVQIIQYEGQKVLSSPPPLGVSLRKPDTLLATNDRPNFLPGRQATRGGISFTDTFHQEINVRGKTGPLLARSALRWQQDQPRKILGQLSYKSAYKQLSNIYFAFGKLIQSECRPRGDPAAAPAGLHVQGGRAFSPFVAIFERLIHEITPQRILSITFPRCGTAQATRLDCLHGQLLTRLTHVKCSSRQLAFCAGRCAVRGTYRCHHVSQEAHRVDPCRPPNENLWWALHRQGDDDVGHG